MKTVGLKQFHGDLVAAIRAGVPLQIAPSKYLTVAWVEHLRTQAKSAMDSSSCLVTQLSNESVGRQFPKWYIAALQAFASAGTMLPVLDGLSVRTFASNEVRRALKWTLIYLALILLVAAIGLWLFHLYVSPTITDFRNHSLVSVSAERRSELGMMLWIPKVAIGFLLAFVLFAAWLLAGGLMKTVLWMGGRHFVQHRVATIALKISQALIEAGLSPEQAATISCDLVQSDGAEREKIESAIIVERDVENLSKVADCLNLTAARRLAYLRLITPLMAISLAGGATAMFYSVLLYWPILKLLTEISIAGG